MNTHKIYLIFLTFFFSTIIGIQLSEAQCDDLLIKQAIIESGSDAVFLKEFKIKYSKSKANRPVRVAKFSAFLKDSMTYRFNVTNAPEFEGKAILQVYRKDKLIGSTYNFTNFKYNKSFDFSCNQTDTYQVLMSFMEGETGCAVGILSFVVNDSMIVDNNLFPEILYLGIDNPLYIGYTDESGCSVQVHTSQGSMDGQNGKYNIKPDSEGILTITAQTIDSLGNVKEEITKDFEVKELPNPAASINMNTGGFISKSEIIHAKELDIHIYQNTFYDQYEILSFTVSDKLFGHLGKASDKGKFSLLQLNFMQGLNPGDQFFISDIMVKKPDGKIVEIKPLAFIIH